MIKSIKQLVDAENNGQTFFSAWRKTPTQTTGAGIWFDLAMSPGMPIPFYYASSPYVSVALSQSADGGIPHGGNVAQLGQKKFLKEFMAMTATATATPLQIYLCDYLMYYPFIDMSVTDEQFMINTATLPRSTTGKNVKVMAVEVAGQLGVGNPRFTITYTNQDGVSGRVSALVACNTQVVNGTIITSATATAFSASPFIPLASGDTGVRSIDSITFQTGDIGLICLVMVEVIENLQIRSIDAPAEYVPVVDESALPQIQDNAYLNLICCPQGTLASAPIFGTITTIWG